MIHSNLTNRLRAEVVKHHNTKYKSVLNSYLKQVAKQLQANNDIVIQRADKSATYYYYYQYSNYCRSQVGGMKP